MYRRSKVDYGKYLYGLSTNKKKPRDIIKLIWAWTKVFLIIFTLTCMVWGCVQMYQPKYISGKMNDMTGNSFFNVGSTFELIIKSLDNEQYHKTFWFTFDKQNNLIGYDYTVINNWQQAFSKTGSPYYGLFVYPMTWFLTLNLKILNGGSLDKNKISGVAVIFSLFITCFIIKFLIFATTVKTQFQQDKMAKFQGESAKIKAKYKNDPSKESKQKMQMELLKLQKKEGVNPLKQMIPMFITMPVLYSLYTTIRSAHVIKQAKVGKIYLTDLPWDNVKQGHMIYLLFFFLYIITQYTSSILPQAIQWWSNRKKHESAEAKKARKKHFIVTSIVSVFLVIVILNIPVGVCIYWIFSSFIQIIQTLAIHYIRINKPKWDRNKREKKVKLQNKKIEENKKRQI